MDLVAEIIEREFLVIPEHSQDKRALLDPDRFGYLSIHYVVKISEERKDLTEYKRFEDCLFEIQIRSILQHSWAEIEHDLGYKTEEEIPRDTRRQFSRLAGLLEIADDEFLDIRIDLTEYENTVAEKISTAPDTVLIDKASITTLIQENENIKALDTTIAEITNSKLTFNEYRGSSLARFLTYVGITTI